MNQPNSCLSPINSALRYPRSVRPNLLANVARPASVNKRPISDSSRKILSKRRKRLGDKILPQQICDLIPESRAYTDLLMFERKLDTCLNRKRIEIEEIMKRPPRIRRKLRLFVSSQFYPEGFPTDEGETGIPSWELRVEGRLLDGNATPKKKFSSFFKSLVIELDRELYGPDSHLVEWHRTPQTVETDGFQVRRPGDQNVKCSILMLLDHRPAQYRLDQRLATLLGFPSDSMQQTKSSVIQALWQYIKTHKLQDGEEPDYLRCNAYLGQLFECSGERLRFADIPLRLQKLLFPPEPIVINHVIYTSESGQSGDTQTKKLTCYDIDVEIDDPIKDGIQSFLASLNDTQELNELDNRIHQLVDQISQLKIRREFFLGFADNPQQFIDRWLASQSRDLQQMTENSNGLTEEERRADFYQEQPWLHEAIGRYIYGKVQQRRQELEHVLGIRSGT